MDLSIISGLATADTFPIPTFFYVATTSTQISSLGLETSTSRDVTPSRSSIQASTTSTGTQGVATGTASGLTPQIKIAIGMGVTILILLIGISLACAFWLRQRRLNRLRQTKESLWDKAEVDGTPIERNKVFELPTASEPAELPATTARHAELETPSSDRGRKEWSA